MNINQCAERVSQMEERRQKFVISVVKSLCLYDVDRKEVQPFIDELKEKHKTCAYLAVEFFNGENAVLRYQPNYEKWVYALQDFFRYFSEMFNTLKERFPDEVDDRFVNIDVSEIVNQRSPWGN